MCAPLENTVDWAEIVWKKLILKQEKLKKFQIDAFITNYVFKMK